MTGNIRDLPFQTLADVFAELEQTASSLKMIDILAAFFKKCTPSDARVAAYLMRGQVAPEYVEGMDFGVAKKLAARAVALAYEQKLERVEARMHKKGDLGSAAEEIAAELMAKDRLSLQEVFHGLTDLAQASGNGSQERKLDILSELLQSATGREAKYIVRIVLGTLRLGVAEMTFLNALSMAITGSKEAKSILEHAFNVLPDIGEISERALNKGIQGLESIEPVPGVPVRVMLAQRVKELEDVRKNIQGDVYVEYKYDGERSKLILLIKKQ